MAGLISRGFLGRRRPAEVESRLPPGQYLVTDFPVLSAGPTPHTPLDRWSFTMEGLVRSPVTWSWDEFRKIGDERQGTTGEGVTDELGRDVEDTVAEAVVGSRGAVVRLVGMQDVQLTGQADTARAAVAKGLHAGRRDADRVRAVPVRLERARGEVHLGALDAVRARSEPDRVPPSAAGSFKTVRIDTA